MQQLQLLRLSMAMATRSKKSVVERINSIYSELKGEIFSGQFDGTAPLDTGYYRKVIVIDKKETKMVKGLTSILDIERDIKKEEVWKAITQKKVRGVYVTKLWCNTDSETKDGWQHYRIRKCEVVRGKFYKGYKAIVDVHVEIVQDEKPSKLELMKFEPETSIVV